MMPQKEDSGKIVVLVISDDKQMNFIEEPIRGILLPPGETLEVDHIQLHYENRPGKMIDLRDARYLIEGKALTELLNTIEKILKEDGHSKGGHNRPPREIKITKREKEILQCIASEMTNEDIARKLFISKRTVDSHRQNLMEKLNIHNTAGLVKVAYKMGLIG
jgi:DNA-binding NarL/FixJ family response regulator